MRVLICSPVAAIGAVVLLSCPLGGVSADEPGRKPESSSAKSSALPAPGNAKVDRAIPEINLLDARNQGLVSVQAEGRGDGRMTLSVTNHTGHVLRVVLPPGLIAQSATGQMGGMGGMGGGMGGMGGRGGMMGGMGGMGMSGGTMPSTMGMMMLGRMIMYFCGDPDSWDMRSMMIGMMGGMGGGMMGGMGGGMMGGMGGGMMGGMGGGMRSVPPSALPSAILNPRQTRHLPTRLVSISAPRAEGRVNLPGDGERLRIIGDIASVNEDSKVQKALRRLTAQMAPTSVAQLVMWRLASKLDWDTIDELSRNWANDYEMTLAKDFVEHLDALPEGETGRLLFQVDGKDAPGKQIASEVSKMLRGKMVLGLLTRVADIPSIPDGPAVACRIRLSGEEAMIQVSSSDAVANGWVNFGKFSVPVTNETGKADVTKFADVLTEGILNRLVRAQIIKGSATKDKGKLVYQLRIDNASPLVLNGLAIVGTVSKADEVPKVLPMISVSARRSLSVPISEDVVRGLGLKKGVKLVALDLSGL
jgi:hypothetical protein